MAFVSEKTKTNLHLSKLAFFADILVPPACPVCHQAQAEDDGLCPRCWQGLEFIRKPICAVSGMPMAVDLGDEAVCLPVQIHPPPYAKARAAFAYNGSAAALVKRLKFGDRPELAAFLARFMIAAGRDVLTPDAVLVPVPLHRRRLFLRRFNQAAELCRAIQNMTGHEIFYQSVARIKPTRQQIGLTRAGRKRNLAGAFAVPEKARAHIKGRTLVLVDDVLTTGATVEALAKLLLRAGAGQVHVLTLARVVMAEQVTIVGPRRHDEHRRAKQGESGMRANDQRAQSGG